MNELTKEEAASVASFIDDTLIEAIRTDEYIDNFRWLRNVCRAYEKLCEYSGYSGMTDQKEVEE